MMRHAIAGSLLAAMAMASTSVRAIEQQELKIDTRPGVTMSYTLLKPDGPPAAAAILFVGGAGQPKTTSKGNILEKYRERFAANGLLVALVDPPSDRPDGLMNFRTSAEHAADIARLSAELRKMANVPLWFIGHSMGSISAASVAGRMGADGPHGLVLSSSVSRTGGPSREAMETVALDKLRQPILVVHHRRDACPLSRYDDAIRVMADLLKGPNRELVTIEGGEARSNPCGGEHYHGYLGLETPLLNRMAAWIKAHP